MEQEGGEQGNSSTTTTTMTSPSPTNTKATSQPLLAPVQAGWETHYGAQVELLCFKKLAALLPPANYHGQSAVVTDVRLVLREMR